MGLPSDSNLKHKDNKNALRREHMLLNFQKNLGLDFFLIDRYKLHTTAFDYSFLGK